ncbi:MAG: two-component regulator propeller domain-containing protein [Pseudomonadota bacterium]
MKQRGVRWTRRITLWVSMVLITQAASGVAAAAGDTHPPMRFDQLSQDHGLSQNNVFTILQDSQGLVWFGTENGLNRYNGYEFEVFKRRRGDDSALGSDYVYDLAEGKNGRLWIATNGGGLAAFDRDDKSFTTWWNDPSDAQSVSSNTIRVLHSNADGTLWLGTLGAGLDRFNPETGKSVNIRLGEGVDDSGANEVFALHVDEGGFLWAGTNGGLFKLSDGGSVVAHFTHVPGESTSLSDQRVRSIFEDTNGGLWIGTYSGGLNRLDKAEASFARYQHDASNPTSLAGDRVSVVFEDTDDRLWIGTDAGLNLLDREKGTFAAFRYASSDATSLADDEITTVFQDRGGLLWVGTRNKGVSKWNPRSWSYGFDDGRTLTASGESQPNVSAFADDGDGLLWIGTFGDGLHEIDRESGAQQTYRHDPASPDSISDDRVMSLLRDAGGRIWIGTMRGGLNRLDPATGEVTVYRHSAEDPASLSANGIMGLFEDSEGDIWAGTYGGGVNRIDASTGVVTRYLPEAGNENSISSTRVRAFAQDPSGMIWMGTDSGGLNLYDPDADSFHHFRHDPFDPTTLADDTVYAVAVGVDGTVWVGTQGGGLDRVVGNVKDPASIHFTNISQADGLSNDVVYGLEVDETGIVWASTAYGINKLDPETGEIKALHRGDGLQSEEFNSGAHHQSSTGELFFGGPNGYNAFRPDQIKLGTLAPLVVLTGVFDGNDPIKADKPIDPETGLELSHKHDNVSFEFAALDYAAPERNHYRYQLEGFDTDWIDLGNRRRVTYTDLNDGHYVLRVQAASSDGVWNEAGLSVPVRVTPAPWDTWWAYLLYCAALAQTGVMLWFAHKRKIRREEEYSSRLEDEVRERTQELRESNSRLKTLNHSLQESSLSDPLTGLRNRRFVFEEVSRDLDVIRRKLADADEGIDESQVSDLVFMMIDLDNFKPINDTYGHAAGDQMLLEVRDVLLGTCRRSDFVVRWGGDEFVIIAKQAKPGESEALAERIRKRIAEKNFMLDDGQVVRTTCSIGFAAYPLFRGQAEAADLDQILTLADSLMYEAKSQRNAWVGMLSPAKASTSTDFDHETIEPSSMLYRAKRRGQLISHGCVEDANDIADSVPAAG